MTRSRRPMRLAAALAGTKLAAAVLACVLSACAPSPSATTPTAAGTAPATARDAAPVRAAAPAAAGDARASGATVQAPASPAAAASPAPAPAPATPAPASTRPASTPSSAALDDRCRSAADCAVKDVGSCCGYNPHCVATSSQPDPAAVRARCAAEGRVGTCGFREVTGCECVQGHCAAIAAPDVDIVR
jgi:hypothetical protein